ncbi:MAG: PRC-barrel domain-containing protein [Planctomycetota bacterium]
MLRNVNGILGYRIGAEDDVFGKVADVYFDDYTWVVRYLVIDTGRWLPGRRVLISPAALGPAEWTRAMLQVSLTREQIEHSPPIAADAPVSRESEALLAEYYGWAAYWKRAPMAEPLAERYLDESNGGPREQVARHVDSHLRSLHEIEGYALAARDGRIGRVADAVVETEGWTIRYLVVDTSRRLPRILSRRVLVSPAWISSLDWPRREVHVEMTRREIEESPEYDPADPINRRYEARLYDYYGRPKYWESTEPAAKR